MINIAAPTRSFFLISSLDDLGSYKTPINAFFRLEDLENAIKNMSNAAQA